MPKRIIAYRGAVGNTGAARQNALPAFLHQQIDALLFLEEVATEPIVKSFAGIARRKLEAQIPFEELPQ